MITQKALCLLAIFVSGMPLTGGSKHIANQNMIKMETVMSTDRQNKNAVKYLYEECLNKRDMDRLRDLISEDYNGINGTKGPLAFAAPITVLIKAFPDIQWTIDELIEEGDKVIAVSYWKGTQKESFQRIPATGNIITNSGMATFVFKDGKIVDSKVLTDRLGFLQELGQIPKDVTSIRNTSPEKNQVVFIDRFVVPQPSYKEFYERAAINRTYIKTLPGFVRDEAYEMKDAEGKIIFITVAVWANEEAIKNARIFVQQEYAKQGFDMPGLIKRLNIVMERGNYKQPGL
ncbi:MAG: ester cyclase [Chryseolinea sp.]